ncbi:hypothetical protein FPV67DRAFT_1484270 [Lyophyllum atratum]|nr:hypothetical protein FPV67DRAFT_1484270 [Lyophyllum atratum]
MQFFGFEVYITVDGVRLPEYEVSADAGANATAATCWIPSEAGKSFAVNWRPLEPRPVERSGIIDVDGVCIGGNLMKERMTLLVTRDYLVTSPTTSRPLMFAPIELTDDDTYLNSENMKDLGDIVLRLSHVESTGVETPKTHDPLVDGKVHERSKKAMVHRVQFGQESVRPTVTMTTFKHISTLATFTFKYRSLDVLRADGIAPPEPVVHNQGGKRKAGEMDGADDEDEPEDNVEEDEAALKAQLRLIQAKLAKKGSKSVAKKVKTEPKTRPSFISGEVIDLTL